MTDDGAPTGLAAEIERLFAVLAAQRERLTEGGPALTATQRTALAAVVDAGPLRLGTLAERIGASDATATRVVDGLERAGFVARTADPTDRRAIHVTATREGERLLRRRRKQLVALLREPLADVPAAERDRFVRLLADLNAVLAGERKRALGAGQGNGARKGDGGL